MTDKAIAVSRERSAQEITDLLYFDWLIEQYGADKVLTWWTNAVRIRDGLRHDPRRI